MTILIKSSRFEENGKWICVQDCVLKILCIWNPSRWYIDLEDDVVWDALASRNTFEPMHGYSANKERMVYSSLWDWRLAMGSWQLRRRFRMIDSIPEHLWWWRSAVYPPVPVRGKIVWCEVWEDKTIFEWANSHMVTFPRGQWYRRTNIPVYVWPNSWKAQRFPLG